MPTPKAQDAPATPKDTGPPGRGDWMVANTDLFLGGPGAAPARAHQAGGLVHRTHVERHGWQDQVRPAGTPPPERGVPSWHATQPWDQPPGGGIPGAVTAEPVTAPPPGRAPGGDSAGEDAGTLKETT